MFNAFRRAALVVALILSVSCTFGRDTGSHRHWVIARDVLTGGTEDDRTRIMDAVGLEPDVVQSAIVKIEITDACKRYKTKDQLGNWTESGHCHVVAEEEKEDRPAKLARQICIHCTYVFDWVTWHECGHAFFFTLPEEARRRWESMKKHAYGDKNGKFPQGGILTAYGATDRDEDFAEWFCWLMCYQYHTATGEIDVDMETVDKSDDSYIRRLGFLRDFRVITPGEYRKLAPLFAP